PSAVHVQVQLLADHRFGHARPNMLFEGIRQHEQQLIHPLLLDDLREQTPALGCVVLAEKSPHLVDRDASLEIQVQVVDQVADELIHQAASLGHLIEAAVDPISSSYSRPSCVLARRRLTEAERSTTCRPLFTRSKGEKNAAFPPFSMPLSGAAAA